MFSNSLAYYSVTINLDILAKHVNPTHTTKQVRVVVTLYTCIREILGSHPVAITDILTEDYFGFPQSLHASTSNRPRPLPSK
jgi:hypothetical protein